MKLSAKALTISMALLWGGAMFVVGFANLCWPNYGEHFLLTMSSVYPGYHATRTIRELLVGTGYGIVDGGVGGGVFAWIYNLFVDEAGPKI